MICRRSSRGSVWSAAMVMSSVRHALVRTRAYDRCGGSGTFPRATYPIPFSSILGSPLMNTCILIYLLDLKGLRALFTPYDTL